MEKKNGLREVFSLIRELNKSLLDLRLEPLPQPRLLMLLERTTELGTSIQHSIDTLSKRALQAPKKGLDAPLVEMKQTLAALNPIFSQLPPLQQRINEDLATVQKHIKFEDFPKMIQLLAQRLRAMGADTEKLMVTLSPEQVFSNKIDEIKEATRSIVQLAKATAELNQWADKRNTIYYKTLDDIFTQLETNPVLAAVNKEVEIELRGIAYKSIVASKLFNEPFYLSQLPEKGKGIQNGLKNYLMGSRAIAPCRFFDDTYYSEENPVVHALRYNPLEHFARYGESMRLNPGPELDIAFYLKSNEDILNAGVSPYRHFVHHGIKEGRPPSTDAGEFFSKEFIESAGGRLAFVGDPEDDEQLAWEVLRSHCSEDKNRYAKSLLVEDLHGQEAEFDGFVVGASALTNLDEERLSALARGGASLVYLGTNPQKDLQQILAQETFPLARVCAITDNYERFLRWQEGNTPIKLLYYPIKDAKKSLPLAEALFFKLAHKEKFGLRKFVPSTGNGIDGPRPVISVVSIIYKKPAELLTFLESLNRQDIAQPYEVVLVDDASPDDTVEQVQTWLDQKQETGSLNRHMDVRILRNDTNSGNCISRNRGIEAALSDIVLVADGDMTFCASNLTEHAWAYRYGDCDAALGFFSFDLNKEFIPNWLAACEIDAKIVNRKVATFNAPITAQGNIQFLGQSIFNYVTKNVSFKKDILQEEYFDPDFSYSTDPESGYGKEDYELGARIYFAGGKMRFVEKAIAIHSRHADNSYNSNKQLASLRNWNKLMAKHPDLALVDRQFYQVTTTGLLDKTASQRKSTEYKTAHAMYTAPSRANVTIRPSRPLRILTYHWQAAHQYEMFKMGRAEFTLATNIGTRHCNQWSYDQRPLPRNVRFAPLDAITPNNFDLAILPFDEHVLNPKQHSTHTPDWGNAFLTMLDATKDIPCVALCHGTPAIYEQNSNTSNHNLSEVILGTREAMWELLGNTHVVCTSHQAQREWEFAKSSVIWHGFSPTEFPPGKHSRGCLTLPRNAYGSRPVYRGEAIRQRVEELLGGQYELEYTAPPLPHPGYVENSQEWALAKFQNVIEYIGNFSIYFNPTLHSPVLRIQGAAMMTGTIPVSLKSHDAEMFIQNGENGFYSDSAEEMAEQIKWLMDHKKERQEISRKARLTAMDIFNIDRYLASWKELITQTIKNQ